MSRSPSPSKSAAEPARSVSLIAHAGFAGNVTERPVAIVAIQAVAQLAAELTPAIVVDILQPASVYEINIEPSVRVVIEEHSP